MAGPEHDIETGEDRPVYQSLYRAGPYECRVIGEDIEPMLRLKIIQPSHNQWSSPVVLVPKKDG